MGLLLKCPGCQTKNPLSLRVCPQCGQSLDHLPPAQRVYVIGSSEAAPPRAAAPRVKPPTAPEKPKPAKQPKKSRPKKG